MKWIILGASLIVNTMGFAQQEEPSVATIDLAKVLGEEAEGRVDLMLLGVAAQDGNCMQSLHQVTTTAIASTLVLRSQCQPTDDEEAATCVPSSLAMKVLGNSADAAHGLVVGTSEELSEGTLLLVFNIADDPKAARAALLDPVNLIVCGITNLAHGSLGRVGSGAAKGDWEMAARGAGTFVIAIAGVESATSFAGKTSASLIKRFGSSAALGDGIAQLIADAGGTLTATAAKPVFAYGAIVQPVSQITTGVAALAGMGNMVYSEASGEGGAATRTRLDWNNLHLRGKSAQLQGSELERAMQRRSGEMELDELIATAGDDNFTAPGEPHFWNVNRQATIVEANGVRSRGQPLKIFRSENGDVRLIFRVIGEEVVAKRTAPRPLIATGIRGLLGQVRSIGHRGLLAFLDGWIPNHRTLEYLQPFTHEYRFSTRAGPSVWESLGLADM